MTHEHTHSAGGHSRSHAALAGGRGRLLIVLVLTAIYMLAEALGGWWSGSLALLADAGHMLTDVAALALALLAMWFGARPATPQKTFGYYRLEIIVAFVNGVSLVVMALLILYEAYERWTQPPLVNGRSVMLIATGGLFINLVCAWLLHGAHEEDLNIRGAWLHVLGDALGSVGAIIAGALIFALGWYPADPLVSALIALLIIWGAWRLIRDSVNVLLEGVPAHINLAAVEETILQTEGVAAVHDLHVWTITSGREALSAHVIHRFETASPELLKQLRHKLHDNFGIDHLTIQLESPADADEDAFHFCHSGTACFRSS